MWFNYTLEYIVTSLIEDKIKNSIIEALDDEKLKLLSLYSQDVDDEYDSDPLEEEYEKFEENGVDNNDKNGHKSDND